MKSSTQVFMKVISAFFKEMACYMLCMFNGSVKIFSFFYFFKCFFHSSFTIYNLYLPYTFTITTFVKKMHKKQLKERY